MRYIGVLFIIIRVFYASCQDENAITVVPVKHVEICTVCTCSSVRGNLFDSDSADFVMYVQCTELDKIGAENVPSLDVILWPPNEDKLKIYAAFEGLGLSNVEWLPYNPYIESLSFSNNLIQTTWPGAFEKLPNLRKLSFNHNKLTEVRADMFTKLNNLEELDLSNNQLTSFNSVEFEVLTHLKKLNMHNNSLYRVPFRALEKIPNLEELDVSNNLLFHFENEPDSLKYLTRINLSGNKLSVVVRTTFGANIIEYIDLSRNEIVHIDEDAFSDCKKLKELNLSDNKIKTLFHLPPSLGIIFLSRNGLQAWPRFPKEISLIDLSHNELVDMYDGQFTDFDNLEILLLGGNQLQRFNAASTMPKLYRLDLSYNLISDIPVTINSNLLPALEELRLDGNPLQNVFFPERINLKSLYLNHLESLQSVGDSDLRNVQRRDRRNEECIHVHLAHCPALSAIADKAFQVVPLCYLDISYNNLSVIPTKMVAWNQIRDGVNLQGNPLDCGCQMQWMLDDVLPLLYKINQNLLKDLRCETPRSRNGLRLVHWYSWTERPLCSEVDMLMSATEDRTGDIKVAESMQASAFNIFKGNSLVLGLSIAIAIVVILIVGTVLYLILSRRRSYKIRKAMAMKRQTLQDTKDANGATREHFIALNKA